MLKRLRFALPLCASLTLVAVLAALALLVSPRARALPPAGQDLLEVSAEVSVTSRLGSETIALTGTAVVEREDPHLEGGAEVVDMELVSMSLAGTSVTGPVSVSERPTRASTGELRSLQPPPDQFPASAFFDVFIDVRVPANPTPTITLFNDVPLRLVPSEGGSEVPLTEWPPSGVTFAAQPEPCVPLLPQLPADVCVTSLSAFVTGVPPTPTDTATASPSPSPSPTPTPLPPTATSTATPAVRTSTATPVPTATVARVARLPDVGERPSGGRAAASWAGVLGSAALAGLAFAALGTARRLRR